MNSASLRDRGTVASSRLSGLLLRVMAKARNGETMNQQVLNRSSLQVCLQISPRFLQNTRAHLIEEQSYINT